MDLSGREDVVCQESAGNAPENGQMPASEVLLHLRESQ